MMTDAKIENIIKNISAVIFDMDGVIVDTEPVHMQAFRLYLDELGLNYDDDYIRSFIGSSVENNIRDIARKYSLGDDFSVKEAVIHRDKIYLDMLASIPLTPAKGLPELLESLERHNIKYTLASSSTNEQVKAVLDNLTLNNKEGDDYLSKFSCIYVSGDDVKRKKPYPDIYQFSVEKLGKNPLDCLAIEDSYSGVQSAKSAGLYCAGLRTLHVEETLLIAADFRINSLSEISILVDKIKMK